MNENAVNGSGSGHLDLKTAKSDLYSSSTAKRTAQLRTIEEKLSQKELDRPSTAALLKTLFWTHAFYNDRPSRRAVQKCLISIVIEQDREILGFLVAAIRQEAQKSGIAATNAFVFVEWCALLMKYLAGTPLWDTFGSEIVLADADALEKCVREPSRPGVAHSAIILARRGIRSMIKHGDSGERALGNAVQALSAKGNVPTAKYAVLLGVIAGVCSRNLAAKPVLATLKSSYLSFYTREIVGSKTPLPKHQASGLDDFFSSFVSFEDLEKDIVPALEKGLLRAPEVVLDDLVTPLVHSLPEDYDLSHALSSRLLKPLLSNIKSSNSSIRKGAVSAFKELVSGCRDFTTIDHVLDEIVNPLKLGKLASADHRIMHSEMLLALPVSSSIASKISAALPLVISKEGSEGALNAETLALNHGVIDLLSTGASIPQAVTDVYVKGLNEKKLPFRRLWIQRTGEILYSFRADDELTTTFVTFAESVFPPILTTFAEVVANPPIASQNGLLSGGLVLCTVASILQRPESPKLNLLAKKTSVQTHALTLQPKPSFLLNARLYSRLTSKDDFRWLYRGLSAVAASVAATDAMDVSSAWSQAFIFVIVSSNVDISVRRESVEALSDLFARSNGRVGQLIIDGIWDWLGAMHSEDKDSPAILAKADNAALLDVIKALCLTPEAFSERAGTGLPTETSESLMCALLVLARPELIPRARWIELCLKVGLDPGELARKGEQKLLNELVQRTDSSQTSPAVRRAAYMAAAELAFVAPETMTSRVIDLIRQDLATDEVQAIGPLEAAIFRTTPGSVFVDVLAKKQNVVPNKNTKDYNILKWEEELRSEVAQKKGMQRKLTADETAKVNAQLKKEEEIRQRIQQIEARLRRGFGIVEALATGPPTDASLWIRPVVDSLLGVINAGAQLVTGDAGPLAFISCSKLITHRLGSMRPFIGVATLRARDITSLPENLMEENVDELITRVLYRLRFVAEQIPLDTVSLIYILPLILLVLEKGGFGSAADDRDAQLVLAIEVLSYHTNACNNPAIPRKDIFQSLISAMQRYNQHYKIVKDCFADMVRCNAPNLTLEEIQVLARGSIVPQAMVRTTVLQSISTEVDMSEESSSDEIWLACHDDLEDNRNLGHEIWEESEFSVSEDAPFHLLPYLDSKDSQLRRAAARALAQAVTHRTSTLNRIMEQLRNSYIELAKPRVPQLDEFGMPRKMDLSDPWESRQGIAYALRELAPSLDKGQLDALFAFLIEQGPLGDQNGAVRAEMLEAANATIAIHGKEMVEKLIKTFERSLEAPDKNSEAGDRVNEAVIIMYGALARHLKAGDSKIPIVIERLLATLNTPSETVQYAIAECLPPLVRTCGDKSSEYFDQVMETLLTSKKYASQRGAAFGLAGLVLGRGISVLRGYRIMASLSSAMENKKDAGQREAALLAYELFSTILGRLFEPYVIQIVPQLLTGFGDGNSNVRDASLSAAKACFAKLSSFGVKQILPTLLEGLDDDQWRSKKGACDLLGAMAYLDPQQLAQSLPDIIPPLTAVLNDSHKEVRAAANKSLKRFGEVIDNPEIKGLVDTLLKALSDPTKYTDEALDDLIRVQFVHYLDAPSLALVSRILQRGLGDRSNTKRKAAQVIGSLAHLTERRDLIAHLPVLVAGLKIAVVDPVPTTRATASRALGSLMEKLGEDALPDLIPGLMQTLKSDTGAGDRLGSAQALSEVLAGLGTARLDETLPTILQNVESAKPAVREGFMSLFIFLPVCFGNSFANYLGRIIPSILSGLADDVESIRETALRAGRLLVKNFAVKAVDLLLPELERGLADDSYRIRLSSVELVGDLLFNLTGISANAELGEEDEEAVKEAGASLREVLGEEKRNKILSALYVCRCDTAGAVRAAAIAVWKALVSSPRILKELVPTLTQLIIRRLGSSNMEHKVIASNALGELIRKAGDGVLSSLLPTLEDALQTSTDTDAKQGICLALKELISSASSDALEDHEKTLIAVVRTALTDSDEDVREAAAEAFDSLQQILGKRAVDQVLPFLLNLLRSEEDADNALAALLTLLTETTRSNIILPNLIPTLIAPPISSFNAKALASLSRVAGPAMNRRLPNIINSLMDNIISCKDETLREELDTSFDTVILSIDEYDGLNTVMNVLLQLMKHEDHRKRAATATHLVKFFSAADVDYSRYNQDIIRSLLISFDDRDTDVVKSSWSALNEFTKKLKKEEMETLVPSTRQTLLHVGVAGRDLPGFELPKGVNAILPIFLQGLMNGNPEQRVQAALAISDIVDRTSENSLKPFVTQITGPLIRVVSERSTDVKAAILLTLNNLLEKMPTALKPFLPQLQRTFAKSLADTSSEILRARAAKALGTLIKFTPRVDPLVAELVTGAKAADPGVKLAMLQALYEVISKAGANMGETSRSAVLGLIDMDSDDRDNNITMTNAKLLGVLVRNVPENVASGLLKTRVLTRDVSHASVLGLNAVLLESPDSLLRSSLGHDLPDLLCQGMGNKDPFIADNFVLAMAKYLLSDPSMHFDTAKQLFTVLATAIAPGRPTDTRRLGLVLTRTVSRANPDMVRPHLGLLVPPVFASVRDVVIPVKLAAEAAFIQLFAIADEEEKVFEKWIVAPGANGVGGSGGADLPATTKRSMQDYFKRVGLRLGAQVRERRDAEGGAGGLGLSNDEVEDEKEVWSVGKMDVGADVFGNE